MRYQALVMAVTAALGMTAAQAAEPIEIIKPVKITEPEKVELGKMLYFEPRLSKSGLSPVTHVTTFPWEGSTPCQPRSVMPGKKVLSTRLPY